MVIVCLMSWYATSTSTCTRTFSTVAVVFSPLFARQILWIWEPNDDVCDTYDVHTRLRKSIHWISNVNQSRGYKCSMFHPKTFFQKILNCVQLNPTEQSPFPQRLTTATWHVRWTAEWCSPATVVWSASSDREAPRWLKHHISFVFLLFAARLPTLRDPSFKSMQFNNSKLKQSILEARVLCVHACVCVSVQMLCRWVGRGAHEFQWDRDRYKGRWRQALPSVAAQGNTQCPLLSSAP